MTDGVVYRFIGIGYCRSGIDRLQAYLSPVVQEVELWYETIKAGRKEGMEVSAEVHIQGIVEQKVLVVDGLLGQT